MMKIPSSLPNQETYHLRLDSSDLDLAPPNSSPISLATDRVGYQTHDLEEDIQKQVAGREDQQGDAGHQLEASSLNNKLLKLLQAKGALVKSTSDSLLFNPQENSSDSAWWQDQVGSPLEHLLTSTKYSSSNVDHYMKFFSEFILPSLGPAPEISNGTLLPTFPSFMTDTHDPIEYGLTWAKGRPSARFSIEALSTPPEIKEDDGLNVRSTFRLCETLQSGGIGSFDVFGKLAEVVTVGIEEELHSKDKIQGQISSQLFLAFDLPHGKGEEDPLPMVKGYLLPHVKSLRTGESKLEVVERGLEAIGIDTREGSAWGDIRSYVTGIGFDGKPGLELNDRPQLVILSNDCHSEEGARIKVYFRYPTTCFHKITQHLSLGGRIFSEWEEPLSKVWETLFDLKPLDSTPTSSTLQHPYTYVYQNTDFVLDHSNDHTQCCVEIQEGRTNTGGTLIYYDFDLSPLSNRRPTSKVYLPVRHFKRSDYEISNGIQSLLTSFTSETLPNLGLSTPTSNQNSSIYTSVLENAFPRLDLNDRGLHTYVCIGKKKDGRIDVSTYLNPNLFPIPNPQADVAQSTDPSQKVLPDSLTPLISFKRSSNSFLHPYSFSRFKVSRNNSSISTLTSTTASSASSIKNSSNPNLFGRSNSLTSPSLFSRLSWTQSRNSSNPSSLDIQRRSFGEYSAFVNNHSHYCDSNQMMEIPSSMPFSHEKETSKDSNGKKKSKTLVARASVTFNKVSEFVRKRSNSVKK